MQLLKNKVLLYKLIETDQHQLGWKALLVYLFHYPEQSGSGPGSRIRGDPPICLSKKSAVIHGFTGRRKMPLAWAALMSYLWSLIISVWGHHLWDSHDQDYP